MPNNQFDQEVLELVNEERVDAGLDPLGHRYLVPIVNPILWRWIAKWNSRDKF